MIAGPNGAGKSTFSKYLSPSGAVIFDVDKVVAHLEAQSPRMRKKQVYEAATQEFFRQATAAVRLKEHFTLETNFRDEGLADIVAQFKGFGYTTNMVYLTLEHIDQSIDRVQQRVTNGGHFVDDKNIRENYNLGLTYLEQFADRFDNVDILDASGNLFELRLLLSVQEQVLRYVNEDLPEKVAGMIMRIAERFGPDNDIDPSRGRGRSR